MSKIIKLVILTLFICWGDIGLSQTLHKLSKDLPQVNKEFHLQVYVMLDSLRNTNFDPPDLSGPVASSNQFFSPIGVSFSICGWDTIHDYNFDSLATDAEFAEMRNLWNAENRINIYVHEELDEPTKCGFAALGAVANTNNAFVVLKKGCPGALAHELGHLFGLLHPFEGNGIENVDGSNCATAGDGICDTPADPYDPSDMTTVWQDGCEFVYDGLDANGQFYQPDMGNVMSYYGCDCGFTFDQYVKMANTYLNSAKKVW